MAAATRAEVKKDADALAEMRRRYRLATDFVKEAYERSREDIKFVAVPGNQWDSKLKKRRGDRATYEFPKLNTHCRQVINEMRQSRPQGKVRGTEEADRGLAELMQGITMNIQSVSNADLAYDIAYEFAVQGGFGVWRICTDYLNDDDFDLDIFVKPIPNPFAVKFDPSSQERDRRDGNWAFVEELMPIEDFERRYPDASLDDFEADTDCHDWREAGQIRLVEYFDKQPMQRELWALSTGATVFADAATLTEEELALAGITIVKRRTVDSHKVVVRISNGHEFLGKPHEFPSKFIPLVPVWGNIQNIDGEDVFYGMVRPNKDQQRLHNVHRTAAIEAVAKAPKAPYILRIGDIAGYENFWKNANAEDYPYLPVKDTAKDLPKRAEQAQIPAALLQLSAIDNEDIKAGTGMANASFGQTSNETSGKAINARARQGQTATFNYVDNLAYAIKFSTEILVDMIPRVYDTPRVVRVLGPDGGEKWKQLYQEVQDPKTGQMVTLNDISKGKYDVTVTVGPSFATQRIEAVEAFSALAGQLGSSFPPLAAIMSYQAVKNLDLPGSEETDKALRSILVKQGLLPPGDGDQPAAPPQPNPKDVASAEKDKAQAANYAAQAQGQELENQAAAFRMGRALAELGPPPQPQMQQMPTQPPQGGFFVPPPQAVPPQGQQFTG